MEGAKLTSLYEKMTQTATEEELKDGFTLWELIAKSGLSENHIRTQLRILHAKGLLMVGRKKVVNYLGKEVVETAWKFRVPEEEIGG